MQHTNRLAFETSPYLLQHAHNPVDWYPWGDEAFQRAKQLNRPILLSIGYSTCHWCHVMEQESFEDVEIAEYLNANYVSVKVDRELRPDVDGVYMAAVQAISGHGGWPMTLWLTPDLKPFFGGTYFPPRDGDRGIRTGFLTLLKYLRSEFDKNPERVASAAGEISAAIHEALSVRSGSVGLSDEVFSKSLRYYRSRFDALNGGMLGAPKFPSTLPIRFLLRVCEQNDEACVLDMVRLTLHKMASGGIYDQVGGGFHRYATDDVWLVPHFEKMLYDNALLVLSYLEAFQVTKDEEFERIVREVLHYLDREMTSPQGALYSATDADSKDENGQSHEGFFFTWSFDELKAVLSASELESAKQCFGVSEAGNFEGRNILVGRSQRPLTEIKDKLYEARKKKPAVFRDEKILTSWNGLVISALTRAGFVLDDKNYIERAIKAADAILLQFKQGFLNDYAFLIAGLLDLYEATSDLKWLKEAIRLDDVLKQEFEDSDGGFFVTGVHHEKLIAREKPAYDGAEPSGNSISLMNLLRLAEITMDDCYSKRADRAFAAFSKALSDNPMSLSEMLLALNFRNEGAKEIVILTPKGRKNEARPFLDVLRETFVPNRVIIVVEEGPDLEEHRQLLPWLDGKATHNNRVTAYVCSNYVCKLPTTDAQVFADQLMTRAS